MSFSWIVRFIPFWKDKKSRINFGICVFLVLLFFHFRYGLGILNPTETAWLMKFDWAQHYMGWYFFRNDPWTFPLGSIKSLFYPTGTNIGFTDSIPLVALALKPFSKILPEQFQYFGFWLFAGHVLVAYFSIKLLRLFKVTGVTQLLAVVLLTFNPMLIYRAMHTALSAHWIVIANLWIYFLDPKEVSKSKILTYQLVLLLVGGLVNPYFSLINGGFLFILTIKLWSIDKAIPIKEGFFYLVGSTLALIIVWFITGYFAVSSASHLGVVNAYGSFSWNLSSLFNPFIFDRFYDFYTNNVSSFLPAFELVSWEQYESFSYLGLGILVLSASAILTVAVYPRGREILKGALREKKVLLLVALTLALSLFAISNVVTYNKHVLFSFSLPNSAKLFSDIFRASARFIWVAYYLWFFFLFVFVVKTISNQRRAVFILTSVALLQFADIHKMIFNKKLEYGPYKTKINEPAWEAIFKSVDKILFLPPLGTSYVSDDDWQYFSFLAAKNRKPISVGHIARIDFQASRNFHQKMLTQITEMNLDSTAVYVMNPSFFSQFYSNYANRKIDVAVLDGYFVVAPSNPKNYKLSQVVKEISDREPQEFLKRNLQISKPRRLDRNLPIDNPSAKVGIYEVTKGHQSYVIRGWCFINDSLNSKIETDSVKILIKDSKGVVSCIDAMRFGTPDVSEFFRNKQLINAGFSGMIDLQQIPNGKYQLGVEITRVGGSNVRKEGLWVDNYLLVNEPIKPVEINWSSTSDKIRYDINIFSVTQEDVLIEGWAFSEERAREVETYITTSNSTQLMTFPTTTVQRPDVASFFNDETLSQSGFIVKFNKRNLIPGTYKIGVLLRDKKRNNYLHRITDKIVDTRTPFSIPDALAELPEESKRIKAFIDLSSFEKYYYKIEGWAFLDSLDYYKTETFLILKSSDHLFRLPTKRHYRPDIKAALGISHDTDSSGFELMFLSKHLPREKYQLYILMKKKMDDSQLCLPLEDFIDLSNP